MKKTILIICLLLFLNLKSYADYVPRYVDTERYYGNGVILIKDKIKVYEKDDENSNQDAIIDNETVKEAKNKKATASNTFLISIKDKQITVLPVKYDTDEWYYICYDQSQKLFGWVKKTENIDYYDWQDFFNIYGRKYGIYIFRNVPAGYKKLYSAPDEKSTLTDSFDFPRYISLWLINKDWMLIKATTYDGITKTGWFRWRTEKKNVIALPDFGEMNY